ncbi:MAG: SpoIIE family protein phosphatase [Bacteroidia bacterium]|nr:SpoIIE family protein phosphatase [Bacteroidia bacterium]
MKVTILLLLLVFVFNCFSQNLKYEIKYYSAKDYGKGLEATNRACVQDKNGVLYFGNAGRIIQYDGSNWSYIPVKQESVWIFSLAVSNENKIYVGAQNEFGYLTPELTGKLKYVSLSDSLKESDRVFSKIIRIHILKNKVVFQSEEALFIYDKGKLTTIFPETSFHLSFLVNNELLIRQRDIGLMKLENNNLLLLKGSEFLKNFGVFSIIENNDCNKLTIITREDGFWSYDIKSSEKERIISIDSTLLISSEIYGAIKLSDGNIALNTLSNGILITNNNLNIISVINKNNGLKVNGVQSILQDYQGNIWAPLDNGISQIQYSSPVSIFNNKSGITGIITDIVRFNNVLYTGTSDGLFSEQSADYATSFNLFKNFNTAVKKLCVIENNLLIGTQSGLFKINNNNISKLFDLDVNTIYYSEKLKLLFVASKNKLIIYKYSGTFNKLVELPEISEEITRFEEKREENGITLWMGTSLQGAIKLQINTDLKYHIDKYNSNDGLIENTWTIPYKINNKVVFSQKSGLLQFVDENTIKNQLPDSLKDKPEFYRGYFDFFNIDKEVKHPNLPFYVVNDSKKYLYVNLDGELGFFNKSNNFEWITVPFCITDIGKTNIFFHEKDSICWIGGDDGLIMFNENYKKNYYTDFKVILTYITCGSNDSVLLDGFNKVENNNQFILNYNLNNLEFSFSSPFYEGQDKMLYSYVLIGQDTAYSQWNYSNHIAFNNLLEGNYVFKVKAKNVYGKISSESTFSFTIKPPWYRTVWSYLLYIFLFIVFIYIGIRINSRRLIEKNKKLEAIILDRTQEIKQKNIVLIHQKEEILDSINYALRIQKAVLPDDELTKEWLGEHFILFRPKDIVSGDFYWTTKLKNNVFFCVADCTGHGVPGAFMSMLCISFLNEVVLKEEITQSEEILNKLRLLIMSSLKQKGLSGEQKDGMDITLCIINKETLELQYSGANNPLYIVRAKDKEPIQCDKQQDLENLNLYEIKADSMPIAIHVNMESFKKHKIQLIKDDRIFLFSDGFADQFGGPKGKKFMYKSFKNVLIETCKYDIEEQKNRIEETINNWIDFQNPENGKPHEQIDDICVMGVKI